jgi:lipoprotein-anchoring transpeptidase ErfK/SrfK
VQERVWVRTPTINHALSEFTENKRCQTKPRAIDDVVNRKAVSVYQTDAVSASTGGVQRRRSGAPTTRTVQSTSMSNRIYLALLAGVSFLSCGLHQAMANEAASVSEPAVVYADRSSQRPVAPVRMASAQRSNMGGGFIEFLFGDGQNQDDRYQQQPAYPPQRPLLEPQQAMRQQDLGEPARPAFDPKFEKQLVDYSGKEGAGTIIVDTPNKFLYLVQGDGKAMRYGIGVGRPGFTWSGIKQISAKKEWPDWTPPPEMLTRRPDLPRHMEGGPQNPLGARAMYLGSSLYRIHGSNEPWTIGTNVSSGCIRMRNEDVIDLYGRVNVGAKVVVI